MNKETTEEEKKAALEQDKKTHLTNMTNHLRAIHQGIEEINIKFLVNPHLKPQTIVHEMKQSAELQIAGEYIKQVVKWAYPETELVPTPVENNGALVETGTEEAKENKLTAV